MHLSRIFQTYILNYLNGLEFLINLNAFSDESSHDAESIVSILKRRKITCASKQNVQRKKAV